MRALRYDIAIKEAETGSSPLISEILGFEDLRKEYETGLEVFKTKVEV